jgi:hypothetical protein
MRFFLFIISALWWGNLLYAQRKDATLLFGSYGYDIDTLKTTEIRFDSTNVSVSTRITERFTFCNSSIADKNGNIRVFTNGAKIYNAEAQVIENGDNFFENSPHELTLVQGELLLPLPNTNDSVVFITGELSPTQFGNGFFPFHYSIVDMAANNGAGKVVAKKIPVNNDTLLIGQITATRHGNGRDWWVIIPAFRKKFFNKFLLTPEGLSFHDKQFIEKMPEGLGQTVFSPDGKWFARAQAYGLFENQRSALDVYRFDRCTGELSEHKRKKYHNSWKSAGVAFSADSRYLYVSKYDTILQYDMQANNIIASEKVVAEWDGFVDELGWPVRFFQMKLSPDERIFINVPNINSRYLSIIEHPELPDTACSVRQHSLKLPTYNSFSMPNLPWYKPYYDPDSPCDTLTVGVKETGQPNGHFSVFPNPTSDLLHIQADIPGLCTAELLDLLGHSLRRVEFNSKTDLTVADMPLGLYVLRFWQADRVMGMKKVVVAR